MAKGKRAPKARYRVLSWKLQHQTEWFVTRTGFRMDAEAVTYSRSLARAICRLLNYPKGSR